MMEYRIRIKRNGVGNWIWEVQKYSPNHTWKILTEGDAFYRSRALKKARRAVPITVIVSE